MIRIVLVDDQTLVRSGIRGLLDLTEDIRVVAEAADGASALAAIASAQPDVVLLDIRMPGMSGIEVLETLRQRGPQAAVILLTTFDDDRALLDGMRAGARGFLLKDISLERLAQAIRDVARGGTIFRPAITERVMQALAGIPAGFESLELAERLTSRETEILGLMAAGMNNREIADALGPSEGTVKNHVSSILSKLGVRDRVRAVLRGLELGYI
ncbi:MAG: response regulator transcription factor [Betaproteobacteria bacterium]|nr:response regulator transcription factor [Betaproteobacteria bacterium]